jgi:succinate dehydrogenase hydrophobic anchor subunit
MSFAFVLKLLGYAWLALFAWFFVKSMFEKDEKYGIFNWQISLLTALFFTIAAPIWMLYDFCKSPKKSYRRWILQQYE